MHFILCVSDIIGDKVVSAVPSATSTAEAGSADFTYMTAVGWIGGISAILIILLITLRSLLDVYVASGFPLPEFIRKMLSKNESEKFRLYLEELGLIHKVKHTRAINFWLDRAHLIPQFTLEQIESRFLDCCKSGVEGPLENVTVGDKSQVVINYFLNLRKIFCCEPNGVMNLSELMAAFVRLSGNGLADAPVIVSRKTGLDLLGFFTASLLNAEFLLFHDSRSIIGKEELNFEYLPPNCKDKEAIIVDDSCVGGDGILEMAQQWRRHRPDQKQVHAFVFFSRSDRLGAGQLKQELAKHDVVLHALFEFKDSDLKAIQNGDYKRVKQALPEGS